MKKISSSSGFILLLFLSPILYAQDASNWFDPDYYYRIENDDGKKDTTVMEVMGINDMGDHRIAQAIKSKFRSMQMWRIVYAGTNAENKPQFYLYNKSYGFNRRLDALCAWEKGSALIGIADVQNGAESQKWIIEKSEYNTYTIKSSVQFIPISPKYLKLNAKVYDGFNGNGSYPGWKKNLNWRMVKEKIVQPEKDSKYSENFIENADKRAAKNRKKIEARRAEIAANNANLTQGIANTVEKAKTDTEAFNKRAEEEKRRREEQEALTSKREEEQKRLAAQNEDERNNAQQNAIRARLDKVPIPEEGLIYQIKSSVNGQYIGKGKNVQEYRITQLAGSNMSAWEFIQKGTNYIIKNHSDQTYLKNDFRYSGTVGFTSNINEASLFELSKSAKGYFQISRTRKGNNTNYKEYLQLLSGLGFFHQQDNDPQTKRDIEWEFKLVENKNIPRGWIQSELPAPAFNNYFYIEETKNGKYISEERLFISNNKIEHHKHNEKNQYTIHSVYKFNNLNRYRLLLKDQGSNYFIHEIMVYINGSHKYLTTLTPYKNMKMALNASFTPSFRIIHPLSLQNQMNNKFEEERRNIEEERIRKSKTEEESKKYPGYRKLISNTEIKGLTMEHNGDLILNNPEKSDKIIIERLTSYDSYRIVVYPNQAVNEEKAQSYVLYSNGNNFVQADKVDPQNQNYSAEYQWRIIKNQKNNNLVQIYNLKTGKYLCYHDNSVSTEREYIAMEIEVVTCDSATDESTYWLIK